MWSSWLEAAPAHCPNSASTVVLDDEGEEVEEKGDREDILLEDSEGDEKETEIAMDVKKLNKSKKSETWIVGESRGRDLRKNWSVWHVGVKIAKKDRKDR